MHDILRERLWRNLEALPEERIYQVLDYVEFLNSKYARETGRTASPVQRFGERLQDHMRLNGVSMGAIRGTLEVVSTADRMVTDLAAAGRTLLREVEEGLRPPAAPTRQGPPVRNLPPPERPRSPDTSDVG
jgi:hypothetical protein